MELSQMVANADAREAEITTLKALNKTLSSDMRVIQSQIEAATGQTYCGTFDALCNIIKQFEARGQSIGERAKTHDAIYEALCSSVPGNYQDIDQGVKQIVAMLKSEQAKTQHLQRIIAESETEYANEKRLHATAERIIGRSFIREYHDVARDRAGDIFGKGE